MKNPLWDIQPEGAEFQYPWFAVAWDFRTFGQAGYNVLVVIIPFNFVIRALYQARLWVWKHSRFGPPPYEMTLKQEFIAHIEKGWREKKVIDLYVSDFGAHRILPGQRGSKRYAPGPYPPAASSDAGTAAQPRPQGWAA